MIPAPFAYARPSTIDEALQAVASGGEDVKILAGGQSLIPVMRLRLAAPETVVDLTRVAELRGVREDGDAIVIGAMTTHSDVLSDPLIARYAPLHRRGDRDGGRPAGAAPRHVRRRAGARRPGRRPAGGGAGPGRRVRHRRAHRTAHRPGGGLLRRLPHHRAGGGGAARGDPRAQARGLGHALREVQPGRAGLVDRGGGRGGAPRGRTDRRGADRADQHGADAAAGALGWRRRWPVPTRPRRRSPRRPSARRRAPARAATSTRRPTTGNTSSRCSRAVR